MKIVEYPYKPTINQSLKRGWDVMVKNFLWLFLALIISGFFYGPLQLNNYESDGFSFGAIILGMFGLAFSLLITPVISYGADMIYLQAVRNEEPDISWLIQGFKTNYINIILANLLYFAIVAIGFIFLIIPGIIFSVRLIYVPYMVMDKGLDPVRAVEGSWKLTSGYGWTIFGLGIVSIGIFILGLICLIVGVLPAMIWIGSSFTSLYESIQIHKQQEEELV